jgi:FMN reductase
MKVVIISGSPRKSGKTQILMKHVVEYTKSKNQDVKFINLSQEDVECYKGPEIEYNDSTKNAAQAIMDADVWLIGTPIYNSFFSAALKNLFEYVNYKNTEGKVAGITILAAGNIGFTDVQTLITQLLSYFRVIANPKAVYLTTESINDEDKLNDDAKKRLEEMVDSTLELAQKIKKTS